MAAGSIVSRLKIAFKALTEGELRHPNQSASIVVVPRLDVFQEAEHKPPLEQSLIAAPVLWIQRSIVQPNYGVLRADGELDYKHEIANLIRRPNPFYAGQHLIGATVVSLLLAGNAYWLIVRDRTGRPIQLWYAPHDLIEPVSENGEFISWYRYRPGGREQRLELTDVVHFRYGIDPNNVRMGLSPLKAVLAEALSDSEAAEFTAALLKNSGVPGVVISPKEGGVSPQDAAVVKRYVEQNFTGNQRGRTLVLTGPTQVQQFGFSPEQLDLSKHRNVNEERICAVLGVPASVVGFGAGLDQTRVGATQREQRRMAWENGVIPLQRIIEGEITRTLLSEPEEFQFDNSDVPALQEDETEQVDRVVKLFMAGIWTRAEARAETGMDVTDADNVFIQSANITPVPASEAKHSHSLVERSVADNADSVEEVPKSARRFFTRVASIDSSKFQARLLELFASLGEPLLNRKQKLPEHAPEDEPLVDRIIALLAIESAQRQLQAIFQEHQLTVLDQVVDIMREEFGLSAEGYLSVVERAVLETGGRRAGLIDLPQQTRDAVFRAIAEARQAGIFGIDPVGGEMAKLIADKISAGPWSSPEIRARVIARTETQFAANNASLAIAENDPGINKVMVLDNLGHFDDEVCMAMDGKIVSIDIARRLMLDEHPNGTRTFVPLTDAMLRELGHGR